MAASSPNGQKGDLRVSWNIVSYGQGHGEWFPPGEHSMLMSHVDAMNKKYGTGTHWLEEHTDLPKKDAEPTLGDQDASSKEPSR